MTASRVTAADFADASNAADHALEAAMEAHSFMLCAVLALSPENGTLTPMSQEAVLAVARHGVDKVQEARDAIDIAGGMFRTRR